MKNIKKTIIIISMLVITIIFQYSVLADNPNSIILYPLKQHVTIGDNFNITVYADITSSIDTCAIDNLSFTPGIINYSSVTQGNLFAGQTMWLTPTNINNAAGYVNPIVWSYNVPVNNTNSTFVTISWTTYNCGIATVYQTAGGTALAGTDPGTSYVNTTIYVHPQKPSTFTVSVYNQTQINLSWSSATGADKYVVERNTVSTWTRGSGTEIYNGTSTSYADTGLSDETTYYYLIWGYYSTSNLFSLDYNSGNGTTPSFNVPPNVPTNIHPVNGTKWVYPSELNCTVTDNDGDTLNVTFYWANGTVIGTDYNVANNSVASVPVTVGHYKNMSWYVIVNDSVEEVQSGTFWFYTEAYDWDINRDATVNYLDTSSLTSHYGESGTPGWIRDDINDDGTINYLDSSSLTSHYGESYPADS